MPKKDSLPVEVVGIVSSSGPGGARTPGKRWRLGVQFSHWRICGGPIESTPLYICREGTEEELRVWMKSVSPRNMLRVEVEFTRSQTRDQKRAKLIVFHGKERSDAELRAAAKDKRPANINDPFFKLLTLDRDADNYQTTCKLQGKPIKLTFDTDDPKAVNKWCRPTQTFLWSARETDSKIRAMAAHDLLDLKNESWLGKKEKKLTAKQFMARLKPTELVVSKGSAFEFVFDDDDLFLGHSIIVHGSLASGPRRAALEG